MGSLFDADHPPEGVNIPRRLTNADSSKRRCVENPRDEWIVHEDERLRIVPEGLWQRVKARQRAQSDRIGERIREGLSKASAKSTGRSPRYLFSTLLKCGACGAHYTIRGRSHFACGRHLDGRACTQKSGIKRELVEPALLEGIRAELLSAEAVQAAVQAAHRILRENERPTVDKARLGELQAQIDNLADAIATGVLKSSPAIAARLAKAEEELARLEAVRPGPKAAQIVPGIADEYRKWIAELDAVLSPEGVRRGLVSDRDIARARAQLKRRLGGYIIVRETAEEIRFETEAGAEEIAIRMAWAGSQVTFPRDRLQVIPET